MSKKISEGLSCVAWVSGAFWKNSGGFYRVSWTSGSFGGFYKTYAVVSSLKFKSVSGDLSESF